MLYALIHKNKVVAGPNEWRHSYFENILRIRFNTNIKIPSSVPTNFPFILDENTSIYEAIESRNSIDLLTQYYHGPHWDLTKNPAIANYNVINHDIVSARNNFKNLVADERYKKEIAGTKIMLQGFEIHLNTQRGSKEPYIQKLLSMAENDTCMWKFDNLWLNLSKNEVLLIIQAIDSHIQKTFDWESNIHTQLDETNVLADLHKVEIYNSMNISGLNYANAQ